MKIALIYDRVNKFGGAERLLSVLHEMYPDAPLFTAVYNKETSSWADTFSVKSTFLQYFPFATTNHENFAPIIPIAFETFNFDQYDLVISVTSEYAKGIITKPSTMHVCVCLTPTRYLWSGYKEYFKDELLQLLAKPAVSYLRTWDKIAAQRPDYYIAISETVRERIKKYYGRESVVIYPPVELATGNWQLATSSQNARSQKQGVSSYFLLVSRLVPYKRVDVAIEAFNKMGWNLKIVGTGREYDKLKNIAGPTIEFLHNLTDTQLSRYYQNCVALIYTAEEDFGLAPIEAQSFGKPVIAFGRGGVTETVKAGVTGEFYYPQSAKALRETLTHFKAEKYKSADAIKQSAQFSKQQFKEAFSQKIAELYKTYQNKVQ